MNKKNIISIEGHVERLFFSNRHYSCRVTSRTKHAVFILLNNTRPVSLVHEAKAEPNPCTIVFLREIPDFFNKVDNFSISNGRCYADKKTLFLQPRIQKSHTIDTIYWKNINQKNLLLLDKWLKKQSSPSGNKRPLANPRSWNKSPEGMAEIFNNTGSQFSKHVKPYLKKLENAWKKNKPNEFFKCLYEPAGSGPGLTPSWDDFISGAITALTILIQSKKVSESWNIPGRKILSKIAKLTTKLSWYYIVFSLLGYCSSWQYKLLEEIGSSRKLKLSTLDKINYGHTSSIDYMYGLFFTANLFIDFENTV